MKDTFGFEVETDLFGSPKVQFTRARANTGYLNSVDSSTLTVEKLRSIIHYDPETGVGTWKITQKGFIKKGRIAGNVDKTSGYRRVCINHILYRSSRLAWFYMTGEWPPVTVDHDNRKRSDDRWNNLRLATATQNSMNIDVRADNASGFKGVYLQQSSGKYHARIGVKSRKIHLGLFRTKEDAAIAYIKAAIKYHGEFARAQQSPKKDLF